MTKRAPSSKKYYNNFSYPKQPIPSKAGRDEGEWGDTTQITPEPNIRVCAQSKENHDFCRVVSGEQNELYDGTM